ncbi:hypothetical protein PCE1_000026 [Barthelona sp. PCE]
MASLQPEGVRGVLETAERNIVDIQQASEAEKRNFFCISTEIVRYVEAFIEQAKSTYGVSLMELHCAETLDLLLESCCTCCFDVSSCNIDILPIKEQVILICGSHIAYDVVYRSISRSFL